MNPIVIFWVVWGGLLLIVVRLDRKYFMLRDNSIGIPRPYSFSRVLLIWWTLILLATVAGIMAGKNVLPVLPLSTLVLIGIASVTTIIARLIDTADKNNSEVFRHQDDDRGKNFFIDVLSDEKGISVHRFQILVFNLVFGLWYITAVNQGLADETTSAEAVIPDLHFSNLILLGLSAIVYVAIKAMENKQASRPVQPQEVPDEAEVNQPEALG